MAKKFMGKFLNILGFEDQETGEIEPQKEESTPYSSSSGRSAPTYQRPPVRRRIDEQPPQQQPLTRRMEESR